ncbi:MAG: hypothetical protein WCF78_00280 [archaeon]
MGYTSLLGELKRTNTGKTLSSRKRESREDEDKEKLERNQDERLALLKKYYKK